MSEYNQVQEEYRDKTKHRITRQLQVGEWENVHADYFPFPVLLLVSPTAGREVTEEEVEELLESGTNVFLKHVRS
jgi:hypothetical protein